VLPFHPEFRLLKHFIVVGMLFAGWSLSGQIWRSLPTEWKVNARDYEDSQNLTFDDTQW